MESAIKVNVAKEDRYSVLKESFHNAPYKLTHYGAPRAQPHLEMIIMSASPGIMDGDHLSIDISMLPETQLKLFTQSFNKLHPMKNGATQTTTAHVSDQAVFHYIPHPVTPFKDSIFKATNEIHLAGDAVLIWGDIIGAGRIHMKEAFLFESLHTKTKIFRDGKLVILDNQFLSPAQQPLQKILFFEGYTHQATFIFSAPFAKELKEELDEILTLEYTDICYGFTRAADDVILLRALGNDGELLYNFVGMLGQLCWDFTQHMQEEATKRAGSNAIVPNDKMVHVNPVRSRKTQVVETDKIEIAELKTKRSTKRKERGAHA